MTKEAKGAATIRRRKLKHKVSDLEKIKNSRPFYPTQLEEINEFNEEDEGYLFDDEVLGPSIIKKVMSSDKTLILSLISIRIVNALLVQTSFVPDEFWQSIEVAHNMVFGYGYMTWEWRNGLRGYMYPAVFATMYKTLAMFGLDNRLLLIKLPRIIQGVIAAVGDYYVYKFSWLLCDRATAQWTLLCQTVNWFMLYCATRTLTNSTETVLIIAAMYYFPWPSKYNQSQSVKKFLTLAALSVIIRPTAAVIWLLLCSWHLQNSKHQLFTTLKTYALVGCTSLAVSACIDRIYYEEWTCVQYNFLLFNVLSGGGSFYGTHPWHWYITQGLPVIMGTLLIPFILGAWKAKNKVPLFVIVWTVFIYSFLAHKEFRFLMPIQPLAFHYCGVFFQSLCKKPKLKKKMLKRASAAAGKNDSVRGSQESLVSTCDGSESNTTEISTEQSVMSSEASGVCCDPDLLGDKNEGTDGDRKTDNGGKGESSGAKVENSGAKGENSGTKGENSGVKGENSGAKNENDMKVENKGKDKEEEDLDVDKDILDAAKKRDLSTNEIVAQMRKRQQESHKTNLTKAKVFVVILLLTNIPVALYFCLIHQRGTILVMKYIHDESYKKNIDVMFLMPCHSTPYYSYIHRNISMRFLTCEPNLQHQENYTDEAEIFYNDPIGWLKSEYGASSKPWPSHLVYFSPLQKRLEDFLAQGGYRQCNSFFHTHLPEGRVGSHVIVSCR